MQLNRNGLTFSVDDAEVTRLVLERFNGIDVHLVAASTVPPAIGAEWKEQGGFYAGVMRSRKDSGDYYLIVGAESDEALAWLPAMDWAKSVSAGGFSDFALPYRKEQALLFANVPELFKEESYWSCEQHASDSFVAWGQLFDGGYQYGWFKDFHGRVRVVRRLIIQ